MGGRSFHWKIYTKVKIDRRPEWSPIWETRASILWASASPDFFPKGTGRWSCSMIRWIVVRLFPTIRAHQWCPTGRVHQWCPAMGAHHSCPTACVRQWCPTVGAVPCARQLWWSMVRCLVRWCVPGFYTHLTLLTTFTLWTARSALLRSRKPSLI